MENGGLLISPEKNVFINPNHLTVFNSGSDMAARAGCNYMLVRFTLAAGKLQPIHTQMTALGCLGNVDNDKALWEAMQKFRRYSVNTSGVWLKDSLGNILVFAQRP
ncbi:META domain-containing protein [Niabella sp. CC-SYL272]|uniref:META domain-containing protein n=1 Tax=Niabella agricola TaxID=2891571 RepID=UPI003872CBD3|nr:META domain-containing protein [Niabella agricola]